MTISPLRRALAVRRTVLVLTTFALSGSLAACGGGGPTGSGADPGSGASDTSSAAASPSVPEPAQEPTALRIAFVPTTPALALHVAQEQGLFKDNDLDVTLTPSGNISDLPAALGRQFDLAIGTATDLIRAGTAGLDVVQVSGNTVSTKQNPFARVIAPADKGITDFGDLAGKRVGSPSLSGVVHVGTLFTAKQQGADPATIKGVQAPPPALPDQLKAGRVDAVEALEPFASGLVKARNVSLGDPFSAIADPLATNFFIAQGEFAQANVNVIERFVEAMEQAAQFIKQSPEQARAILQEYTKLPPPIVASVPLPTFDFEVRQGDLQKWAEVLVDLGQLDGEVDTSTLVLAER